MIFFGWEVNVRSPRITLHALGPTDPPPRRTGGGGDLGNLAAHFAAQEVVLTRVVRQRCAMLFQRLNYLRRSIFYLTQM